MSRPTLLGQVAIANALAADKREQLRRIDEAYEDEMRPHRKAFKAVQQDADFRAKKARQAVNAWHLKACRAAGVETIKVADLRGSKR